MLRKRLALLVLLLTITMITVAARPGIRFRTRLTGAQEVPAVTTDARGKAEFILNHAHTALRYRITTSGAEDTLASHIHCAPAGENGPIGVTLAVGPPVVSGVITEPDAGNSCGWESLADVLDAIRSGDTYVNVHTTTVPSGELRGQLP